MKPASGERGSPYSGQGIAPDIAFKQRHQRAIVTARAAAQAWAVAQQQRPVQKKLAPWDENRYFQEPVVTHYAVNQNTDTLVAPSNPQRIALIFTTDQTGGGTILLRPGSAVDPANPAGMTILNNMQPLRLLQKELFYLVQVEWHAITIAMANGLNVIELILREVPPEHL